MASAATLKNVLNGLVGTVASGLLPWINLASTTATSFYNLFTTPMEGVILNIRLFLGDAENVYDTRVGGAGTNRSTNETQNDANRLLGLATSLVNKVMGEQGSTTPPTEEELPAKMTAPNPDLREAPSYPYSYYTQSYYHNYGAIQYWMFNDQHRYLWSSAANSASWDGYNMYGSGWFTYVAPTWYGAYQRSNAVLGYYNPNNGETSYSYNGGWSYEGFAGPSGSWYDSPLDYEYGYAGYGYSAYYGGWGYTYGGIGFGYYGNGYAWAPGYVAPVSSLSSTSTIDVKGAVAQQQTKIAAIASNSEAASNAFNSIVKAVESTPQYNLITGTLQVAAKVGLVAFGTGIFGFGSFLPDLPELDGGQFENWITERVDGILAVLKVHHANLVREIGVLGELSKKEGVTEKELDDQYDRVKVFYDHYANNRIIADYGLVLLGRRSPAGQNNNRVHDDNFRKALDSYSLYFDVDAGLVPSKQQLHANGKLIHEAVKVGKEQIEDFNGRIAVLEKVETASDVVLIGTGVGAIGVGVVRTGIKHGLKAAVTLAVKEYIIYKAVTKLSDKLAESAKNAGVSQENVIIGMKVVQLILMVRAARKANMAPKDEPIPTNTNIPAGKTNGSRPAGESPTNNPPAGAPGTNSTPPTAQPEPHGPPRPPKVGPTPPPKGSRGVWDKPDAIRGEVIEKLRGQNLPQNYPVIDKFNNGVVTSIKSVDLAAPSYQSGTSLLSVCKRFVDKVIEFKGKEWAKVVIKADQIKARAVEIVVPSGATASQKSALLEAIEYGKTKGVTVIIVEL